MGLPAAGYLENAARTEGEMKTAFEDQLKGIKQIPGAGVTKQSLTISAGSVTPAVGSAQILEVDTEAAAATDDLANIVTTNLGANSLVLVKIANAARTVRLLHAAGGTGQMSLRTGDDMTLANTSDWVLFFVNGTQLDEIARFPSEAVSAVAEKTANYTVTTADRGKCLEATSGTWTLTLPAVATVGLGFAVAVKNSGTGTITIDGDGSETIDGVTTVALNRGESYWLVATATAWKRLGYASMTVSDARTNSVDAMLTLTSTTSGTPAAGIGTGVLFKAESADEDPADVGQIQAAFSDVSAGSEDSYWEFLIRRAGAALAAAYRFVATGSYKAVFTHANTADRTYTLPDASTTLVGQGETITSGTAVASTSGATVDFTGIPSWATRVTIMLSGVSLSGTDNILVQIGDAGGLEASGYTGSYGYWDSATTTGLLSAGFLIVSNLAANVFHGRVELSLLDAATNTWVAEGQFGRSGTALIATFAGTKALSATLDRISLVASGANTFDAGSVNIMYE